MKKRIAIIIALVVLAGACFYAYRIIFPPLPPQAGVTEQVLQAAKDDNAATLRRLDELEKTIKKEVQIIKAREREYVDSLPPDAVAVALTDELRVFLGSD